MKKLLIAALALIMLQAGIAEGEMDYRAIGSQARIYGTENGATITLLPGEDSQPVCTVPERADIILIGENADGYALVNYDGCWGYAYWDCIDVKSGVADISGKSVLAGDGIKTVNDFISKFTRAQLAGSETGSGAGVANAQYPDLEKFAAQQLWLSGNECVETGEYGDGNDIRISEDSIAGALSGFFDAGTVSASSEGNYRYFNSSDFASGPFAVVTDFSDVMDGKLVVKFNTYGAGSDWEESSAGLAADAAASLYPENIGFGYAIIAATDFSDSSSYRLVDMIAVY